MMAQTLGCAAARALRAEHGTNDPEVLAARLGVQVVQSERDGGWGTVVVFADYRARPPTITLYPQAAAHRARYLAHVRFHHLEALHPECRRARLQSEQAAWAFADELLR
jgi:hypothetical protein